MKNTAILTASKIQRIVMTIAFVLAMMVGPTTVQAQAFKTIAKGAAGVFTLRTLDGSLSKQTKRWTNPGGSRINTPPRVAETTSIKKQRDVTRRLEEGTKMATKMMKQQKDLIDQVGKQARERAVASSHPTSFWTLRLEHDSCIVVGFSCQEKTQSVSYRVDGGTWRKSEFLQIGDECFMRIVDIDITKAKEIEVSVEYGMGNVEVASATLAIDEQ
jgi:hypothetical protein